MYLPSLALTALFLCPWIAAEQEDIAKSSGKDRIVGIMTQLVTKQAPETLAVTKNLSKDLNLEAITDTLGCKTAVGRHFLVAQLAQPYNRKGLSKITRRQSIIKKLVENPRLKKEVEMLIERARVAETAVIELFSGEFIGRTCPELKQLALMKEQRQPFHGFAHFIATNRIARSVVTAFNLGAIGTLGKAVYMGIKPLTNAAFRASMPPAQIGIFVGLNAYLSLIMGVITYGQYKDFTAAFEKRDKLHGLSELADIATACTRIGHEEGLLLDHTTVHLSSTARELMQELLQSRYRAEKSRIFATPLVHAFLYKLYEHEAHLSELFACVAELDMYNALATYYLAHQDEQGPRLCFTTFLPGTTPLIRSEQFWNMLVTNPVTNSLDETRNIILTGANAGGKTTTIRALLQNIVFSQTFGIAAATSCEMTLMDNIYSYLNVSDDLMNGLSLFASEVKRAQEILQVLRTTKSDETFFFVLDELFTGTAGEEGEFCACEFVKRIAQFPRAQFIYATHFKGMKEVGELTTRCCNYKMDAPVRLDTGKLAYPFKMSKGANNINVALDMAREARLFD